MRSNEAESRRMNRESSKTPNGVNRMPGFRPRRAATITTSLVVAVLTIVFLVPMITALSYHGAEQRVQNRTPNLEDEPTMLVLSKYENVGDPARQPAVVLLATLDGMVADPPPGIDQMPRPGEIYISPEMEPDTPALEQRYGTVVGTIQEEGLASSDERLAYVGINASVDRRGEWYPADTWGNDHRYVHSETLGYRPPLGKVIFLELVFLVLPAAFLTVAAFRAEDEHLENRYATLEVLGATPWQLAWIAARRATPGIVIGAGVTGVGLTTLSACFDVMRIPALPHSVYSSDLASGALYSVFMIASAMLFAYLISMLVAVRRRHARANRVRTRDVSFKGSIAFALSLFGVLIGFYAQLQAVSNSPITHLWWYGAILVCLAAVAYCSGAATMWLASAVDRLGRKVNNATMLLVGRNISSRLRRPARTSAVYALVIFSAAQIAGFSSLAGTDAVSAVRWHDRYTGEFAEVLIPEDATSTQLAQVVQEIGRNRTLLVHVDDTDYSRVEVMGSEAALEAAGLSLGSLDIELVAPGLASAISGGVASLIDVRRGSIVEWDPEASGSNEARMIILSSSGPVRIDALQRLTNEIVSPGWSVQEPGEGWRRGALISARDAFWISAMGAPGFVIWIGALSIQLGVQAKRVATELAPLLVISGNARSIVRISMIHAVLIAVPGISIGAIAGYHLHNVIAASGLPVDDLYSGLLILMFVGISSTILGALLVGTAGLRIVHSWRPGKVDV